MQWAFLVLAVLAALAELHSGTFYLAGAAVAALFTALIGFWVRGDMLIFVFVLACGIVTPAIRLLRGKMRPRGLADFDIGQSVTIESVSPQQDRFVVRYRGTSWQAVMDDGSLPAPGTTAIIQRRSDKLLHLALPVDGTSP